MPNLIVIEIRGDVPSPRKGERLAFLLERAIHTIAPEVEVLTVAMYESCPEPHTN